MKSLRTQPPCLPQTLSLECPHHVPILFVLLNDRCEHRREQEDLQHSADGTLENGAGVSRGMSTASHTADSHVDECGVSLPLQHDEEKKQAGGLLTFRARRPRVLFRVPVSCKGSSSGYGCCNFAQCSHSMGVLQPEHAVGFQDLGDITVLCCSCRGCFRS